MTDMTATFNSDSRPPKGLVRTRRTSAEAKEALLGAAHTLLRERGPAGVTLQAVAKATGVTHGNVTHHFGTSSTLHAALISNLSAELATETARAVAMLRRDELDAQDLVDLVFSAFADSGCGRLIGWLAASGDRAALSPIFDALEDSVRQFRADEPKVIRREQLGAGPIALEVLSHALTASLVGAGLEAATDMPADSLRRIAADRVRALRAKSDKEAN